MPGFGGGHDCGGGCACIKCRGCIRAGERCKIFPIRGTLELAETMEPLEERFGPEELVTINVSDLTLAEVAAMLSGMLRDPVAIPAEMALEPVSMHMEDARLSEVVEALGLLTR